MAPWIRSGGRGAGGSRGKGLLKKHKDISQFALVWDPWLGFIPEAPGLRFPRPVVASSFCTIVKRTGSGQAGAGGRGQPVPEPQGEHPSWGRRGGAQTTDIYSSRPGSWRSKTRRGRAGPPEASPERANGCLLLR